jgi:16S rRNA (guanine966-N2)-methyltransferase
MRVVGGKHKGRRLAAPQSRDIRPTSDRTREALFNVLTHGGEPELEGARVLDLFAGTGALGIEALSRGGAFCLFVDQQPDARALIRRNIEELGLTGVSKVWRRDATRLGSPAQMPPFDFIFADPPYGKGLGEQALQGALADGWAHDEALFVLEEKASAEIGDIDGLRQVDKRTWGDTCVRFYHRTPNKD